MLNKMIQTVLALFMPILKNQDGMAALEGDNYALTQLVPISKIEPPDYNGRVKGIFEVYTLAGVVLADGDTIDMPLIPEGARILRAFIQIPQTLGTTGKIKLGLRAYVNRAGTAVAENDDSLVTEADAGGQAALGQSATANVAIGALVGLGGAQPFATVFEASTVTAGEVYLCVEYLLPS